MTSLVLYTLAGAGLFVAGLYGLLVRAHLFWKMMALNVLAGGTFLILVAASPRSPGGAPDPVPQAMVLTGIVVAVGSTALGLAMALRVAVRTGRPFLHEVESAPEGPDTSDGHEDGGGDGGGDG